MGILPVNNIAELNNVTLRRGADQRLRAGHLWVFSNELQDGFQSLIPGEIVAVQDSRGYLLGTGMVNPHSLITVRLLSRKLVQIDESFLSTKINAASDLRKRLFGDSASVYRLVYAESDGLPGLIIDRFNNVFVLQSNTAGMDRLLERIMSVLVDLFQPVAVIAANDAHVRELEGLPLERKLLHGDLSGSFRFQQDGITFIMDPLAGQKTGFFLDQAANRRLASSFICSGDQVLDLFCYTGGFGLYALKAGAGHVTFVDSSEPALTVAREAVEANGFSDRAEFVKADIFEWIKQPDCQFDMVILDPPALAKARTKVPAALRAYRDLNARAMSLLKPAGVLVTASCSGLVHVDRWLESLRDASQKADRNLRFLARGGQSPDHPILASMPETEYLKFAIGIVD
ncbi:class I SAM-dependent rRNA methyltransferase [candidate division KSB1 bacterium]|nr:MAG: class I SAM-dependent rRNA methyltransferase [candidate division KSB1 bacterium]